MRRIRGRPSAAGGDTLVQAWKQGSDGNQRDSFFRRTLHAKETTEVQIYAGGGETGS